jgi:hypothetical protein
MSEHLKRLLAELTFAREHLRQPQVTGPDLSALIADYDRWRADCVDAVTALAALRDSVTKTDRAAALKMRDAVLAKAGGK